MRAYGHVFCTIAVENVFESKYEGQDKSKYLEISPKKRIHIIIYHCCILLGSSVPSIRGPFSDGEYLETLLHETASEVWW